jgi:phosphoglycerate dehydrogenase-like enzyme
MPTVLITPEAYYEQPGPHVTLLREAGFTVSYPRNRYFTRGLGSEDEAVAELGVADAVIAGGEVFTEKVLANVPRLRVIARSGVGYDRVNVPAATAQGIVVTITPTANHEGVAEHALALLLAVAKGIVRNDRLTRAGGWPLMRTLPLRTKTLGILGLGRIGRSLAVRVRALGMPVLATETFPIEAFVREHRIELVDFETLLARSDYLSIHCPLNDATRGLFNASVFARMKQGSVLINTARGGLVVEADLLAALRSGHLGGAGLDVYEQEPTTADNPLFQLDNVAVAPHLAGADALSVENMAIEAAQGVIQLYRGGWPEGAVVNPELKGRWQW